MQNACGALPLSPARNERGESRREGKLIRGASSPRPSPPFLRRRGRENTAARSKQIFCRTQLIKNLRCANRFVPLKIWTNVPSFHKPFSTRRFEAELRCTDTLAAAARRRLPSRRSRQDPAGAIPPLRPSSHRIDPLGSASQVGEQSDLSPGRRKNRRCVHRIPLSYPTADAQMESSR